MRAALRDKQELAECSSSDTAESESAEKNVERAAISLKPDVTGVEAMSSLDHRK